MKNMNVLCDFITFAVSCCPQSAHFGGLFRDLFGSDSLHSRTECEVLKITLVKHMFFEAN